VSAYPKEVTAQMAYNFIRGGAGINVLARHVGAKIIVVDIGVATEIKNSKFKIQNFKDKKINYGTKNFTQGPAMNKEEAIKSIETGIELVEEELKTDEGIDPAPLSKENSTFQENLPDKSIKYTEKRCGVNLLGIGDMGIANTTPSSAITSVICNVEIERVTGRGTGIDEKMLRNKIAVIKKALTVNNPNANDPIDIFSKVGGFEIGGLAGIILAGVANKIPVVIDGFISGAAALIACKMQPLTKEYLFAGHCSEEPGHLIQFNWLGVKPILNLNLRLGEGTGACLAMNIIEASIKILTEMATFESSGVSKKM